MRGRTVLPVSVLALIAAAQAASVGLASDADRRWLDNRVPRADREALDRLVGYAPPDFADAAQWLAADAPSWDNLRGKVVVVQTWSRRQAASAALPERLVRALSPGERDGLELILVHLQDGADGAEAFLERRAVAGRHVIDHDGAFAKAIGVERTPVNLVIGRDGRVRFVGLSLQGLPAGADALLAEPFDPDADPAPKAPTLAAAADAEFPPIEGEVRSASDIRGARAPSLDSVRWMSDRPPTDASVTFVEFYATWCPPCNAMIPKLNKYAQEFAGKVEFLVVSREEEATVRNAARSGQFKVPVGHDVGSRLTEEVGVRGIPHAYIVCSQGIVRWQGNPHSLTNEVFEQIIAADAAQRQRG